MFSFIADKLNVKNLGEMLAPTLTPEQELHAAIESGMQDKFAYLLDEMHVSASAPSSAGNQPIHTAAYHGRIAMIEMLLMRGIDVNTPCPRENAPLHFAAAQGHEDAVRFLIDHGANPALRNRNGRTAYDAAKGDRIRQYLLPLQFRHEDPKQAVSYLPPGITPSVDPLAPKPEIAPPPMSGDYSMMAPPPQQSQMMPPNHNMLYAASTHSAIPRGGGASRITRGEYRPIQADGFGSSVGNEELTAKFGNTREIKVTAPPPNMGAGAVPNAANAPTAPTVGASSDAGANPYSAKSVTAPSPGRYPGYAPPQTAGAAARGPPQFKIFNPKLATAQTNAPMAAPGGYSAPPTAAQGQEYYGEEVNLSASTSVLQ